MAPTHNQNLTTPVFAAVDTGLFQETGGLVRKLGEEGEFDHGRIFGLWSPHGLIERPNELCIYYGGCSLGKELIFRKPMTREIGLARFRKDGLVCLEASSDETTTARTGFVVISQ